MKKNKLFWILTVGCVLNFAAHLYFYPSGHCAYPLGRKRTGQRLGAEVHHFDFGRSSVCNAYYV